MARDGNDVLVQVGYREDQDVNTLATVSLTLRIIAVYVLSL